MSFDPGAHTIFLTLAGSQAQGTAREGSDVDLRGVCVAPLSARLSLGFDFEQEEGGLPEALEVEVLGRLRQHPTASGALGVKTECVIFELYKFTRLCAVQNPGALEVLFSDPNDWVYETTTWRTIYESRHLFITKKVKQTFFGYAMSQLKKIKTHRAWLLHPPEAKPSREAFGLPRTGTLGRDVRTRIERQLDDKLRSYGVDDIDMPQASRVALRERLSSFYQDALSAPDGALEARMRAVASHGLSLPAELVSTLNAERRYRDAMRHWEAYQAHKTHRNPARAALERAFGYDSKHAMHLVRLMRMGLEALRTGELQVRRPDAAELLAIRDGAMSFDELMAYVEQLRGELEAAAAQSDLPEEVDAGAVDALLWQASGAGLVQPSVHNQVVDQAAVWQ